jgi:hypothetical protein
VSRQFHLLRARRFISESVNERAPFTEVFIVRNHLIGQSGAFDREDTA